MRPTPYTRGGGDLMDQQVELDRRMLDWIVGLDTEMNELVEGSHLYLPKASFTIFVKFCIPFECYGYVALTGLQWLQENTPHLAALKSADFHVTSGPPGRAKRHAFEDGR